MDDRTGNVTISRCTYLGVRDFDDDSVPIKSRIGNKLTRIILKVLIGGDVSDTQTGLRGIPNRHLDKWVILPGERFEYETVMLIDAIQFSVKIHEVPIRTVYINDDQGTHFDPVKDSLAIYRTIFTTFLKYIMSAFLSFLVDYGLFCLIVVSLGSLQNDKKIWIATFLSRVCSSLFNYAVNKNVVFRAKGKKTILKYYGLCMCQLVCSASLVSLVSEMGVAPVQFGKIMVDTILFLCITGIPLSCHPIPI